MGEALVSIIINNYNYGRFLKDAIDSALSQSYADAEVIVVDDGSTDDSREIIIGYEDKIISVLKENGGQASALNAGFAASRGDIVIFLDSDDMLLPTATERATKSILGNPDVVKVHWPLWIVDERGRRTGEIAPDSAVPEGDFHDIVACRGPDDFAWPPTSGNAWTRALLEHILPIPETTYKRGADSYLTMLAPFFGPVAAIRTPQSLYRQHGRNSWRSMSFDVRLEREVRYFENYVVAAREHCEARGYRVNMDAWRTNSWWWRLRRAVEELAAWVPPGEPFILVDNGIWGMDVRADRRPIPFLERNGRYWGPPPDDVTAIREFERLRRSGARFLVFAWPAFWWLHYYAGFHDHLRANFPCLLENERVVLFEL
jgi:glycosyltransferase involved in cell wall biosynthesis